jgi:hypothetical protein
MINYNIKNTVELFFLIFSYYNINFIYLFIYLLLYVKLMCFFKHYHIYSMTIQYIFYYHNFLYYLHQFIIFLVYLYNPMKISEKLFFVFFNCFTFHDKFLCHKYAFDQKKSFKIT